MSALGQKQTLCDATSNVRFTPESGHCPSTGVRGLVRVADATEDNLWGCEARCKVPGAITIGRRLPMGGHFTRLPR